MHSKLMYQHVIQCTCNILHSYILMYKYKFILHMLHMQNLKQLERKVHNSHVSSRTAKANRYLRQISGMSWPASCPRWRH